MDEAAEQIRRSGEGAWDRRWMLPDANGDGVITISDTSGFLEWIFFAPGDWMILMLMTRHPEAAQFLEISPDALSAEISGVLSLCVWLAIVLIVAAILK